MKCPYQTRHNEDTTDRVSECTDEQYGMQLLRLENGYSDMNSSQNARPSTAVDLPPAT